MLKWSIRTQVYVKIMISFLLLLGMITFVITTMVWIFQSQKIKVMEEKTEALILVNDQHPLPENYYTKRVRYKGITIAEVIKSPLERMMKEACADGICLFFVSEQMNFQETNQMVQQEHQSGLALDFYRSNDDRYNNKMWAWLKQNAAQYGFIERYQEGKEHKTNQITLPWHYRYVGIEHAKKMHQEKLCLEEYLEQEKKEGV